MSDADVGAEGGAGISAEEPCPLEFFCNEVFLCIYQVDGGWGGEGIYYGPRKKILPGLFCGHKGLHIFNKETQLQIRIVSLFFTSILPL